MISRSLKLLWIVVVLAVASAGAVLIFTKTIEDVPLYGVEVAPEAPALTFGNVFHERYQPIATQWFERHWGLRGYAVRTDNTLNDDIFRETRTGQHVAIGRGFTLYHIEDVAYYERPDEPTATTAQARRFARLQKRLLAEREVVLLPVVLPSKSTLLRDEVPTSWRRGNAEGLSDTNLYGAFVKALREEGAFFVDGRQMLLDDAGPNRERRYEIYPRTARHISTRSSCRVMQAMADAIRPYFPQLGTETVDCSVQRKAAPSLGDEELDLQRLLNTWQPPPPDVEVFELSGKPATPAFRIPTLFVGSSFMNKMVRISRELGIFRPSIFYYYDKTIFDTERDDVRGEVKPHTPEWRADTWSKKLFIVDVLETYLPVQSVDFLDEIEDDLKEAP